MDAGAFSNDKVAKAADGFIRVLVDADKDNRIFGKYGVSGMPTILFLDASGKQLGELGSRDPGAVEKQLREIAAKVTRGPEWMEGADRALDGGKSDSKPVVLFFTDDKPKSAQFIRKLGDPSIKSDLYQKCVFAKVEFKKDSEECKKWKVTEAPTFLIIDPTGDEAKVLKTLKTASASDFKSGLEEAIKKVEKK